MDRLGVFDMEFGPVVLEFQDPGENVHFRVEFFAIGDVQGNSRLQTVRLKSVRARAVDHVGRQLDSFEFSGGGGFLGFGEDIIELESYQETKFESVRLLAFEVDEMPVIVEIDATMSRLIDLGLRISDPSVTSNQ